MYQITTPHSRSTLRMPRASLRGCVRCFVTRDTSVSAEGDFWSVYPASPFPSFVWTVQGHREIIEKNSEIQSESPRTKLMYVGPSTRPLCVRESEHFSSFAVVLQPDAPHTLFGWDASHNVSQAVDIQTALPQGWQELSKHVLQAHDHNDRQQLIEQFLEARWILARSHMPGIPKQSSDWIENMAIRVSISKPGSGIRQIERRYKTMIGLSQRQLKILHRGEKTLFAVRSMIMSGKKPDWSKLCSEIGYYDQAHLCREIKRMTGHPPQELLNLSQRAIDTYWIYRLWS